MQFGNLPSVNPEIKDFANSILSRKCFHLFILVNSFNAVDNANSRSLCRVHQVSSQGAKIIHRTVHRRNPKLNPLNSVPECRECMDFLTKYLSISNGKMISSMFILNS